MRVRISMLIFSLIGSAFQLDAAQSDLALGMSASRPSATVNELVTWRLSVTNLGSSTANNVVITNWLPTSATLFSVTASQGSITTNAGAIRFSVGTLASGGKATAEVTVFSATTGSLTNRARTISSSSDPQSSNNGATNSVRVVSARFQLAGSMNLARKWHSATLLSNGKVLVVGGHGTNGNTRTCEVYDPATGQFTFTGDTIGTHVLHSAVALTNGRVLVVSGIPPPEIYNPLTGTWTNTGPMVFPRSGGHAMSALKDGRVLVTGGYGTWTNAEVYNPSANAWAAVTPMNLPRQDHVSITMTNGRALIIGGYYAGTNAELFTPATSSFAVVGGPLRSRSSGAAVLLTNNTVLLAGGYDGFGVTIRSAELYDPATEHSVALGDMVSGHWDFPGVLLNDGQILLAGGAVNYAGSYWAVTADAELFTPAAQTFTPTVALNFPRRNHTATRLTDGRVLITGGFDTTADGDTLLASAEIYDPASAKSPPIISIANTTVLEGDYSSNTLVFNVALSSPMGVPVSVNFNVTSDSAQAGSDFQATAGTLVFAPGTTNQQIVIAGVGDRTYEPDESLGVTLFSPTNAVLGRVHSATGTLLNDDPMPTVNAYSSAVVESNLLTAPLRFTIALSSPSQQDVQVNFATADGTATAGIDYRATNGVLVFPAGTTTQTVVVVVNGDIDVEPAETFQLLLSTPLNATIGSHAVGTILNDDGLPGAVHHFDVSSVPSPQYFQVPFPLTVTARDISGAIASSFNGPVLLRVISNSAPPLLFDIEDEADAGWTAALVSWPYWGGFGFAPYDVTGQGVTTRALILIPFYDWSFGVNRDVALVGGVTYTIRFDAAQVNDGGDPFFDYTLTVGGATVAQAPIRSLGLPPGQIDRRAVAGTFTAPSNGVYKLTILLSTVGSALHSSVYVDNLRIEPAGVTPAVVTLTNGTWTGSVKIAGVGTNLMLQAVDLEHHAGLSNPFEVRPSIDVSVSNTFSFADSPSTFQQFSIQSCISNSGLITATGVLFSNVLPAGFDFISASTTDGQLTNSGGTVVCTIASLPAGSAVWVTTIARAGGEGITTNLSVASANEADHDLGNNVLLTPITVVPPRAFIEGTTVTESPAGTNAVFTVWLSSSNNVAATMDYATSSTSAVPGVDFVPASGSLAFAPGVRTQWISVAVLDDLLDEWDGLFTLTLSNASHAQLNSPATGTARIIDDDPEPAVSIGDAALLEGDSGNNVLSFPVSLSAPSAKTIVAYYVPSNGTAVAGNDYYGGFVSVTFAAGETNGVVSVMLMADTINEPDETFSMRLTSSANATPGRAQATGTILNDDAVPGKFDRFTFDPIPVLRVTNVPFRVTVRAIDYLGNPVTNSPSFAQLSATNSAGPVYVTPLILTNFINGVWSGEVKLTNIANNVSLRVQDDARHVATSGSFNVVANYPFSLSLPSSATEGDGVLSAAGTIIVTNANDADALFLLISSDTNELRIPSTVLLPAGQTNVAFDLTVVDDTWLDGSRGLNVIATATNYTTRLVAFTVHDNEPADLTVELPTGLSERKGFNSGTGTVHFSRAMDTYGVLYLTSSIPGKLSIPDSIGLYAGQTSVTFAVTVPDNAIIDGPQSVTVTAHLSSWAEGAATTIIEDDDTNISVFVSFGNDLPIEGSGTRTNGLIVQLGGTNSNDVTVQLFSSYPQKVGVPSSLTIPAGRRIAATNITLFDDSLFDGSTNVTVTASATGFTPGTRTFTVLDNDVHHFAIASIPTIQTSGIPFPVSVSAKDVTGATMTFFRGSLGLTVVTNGSSLPMTPIIVSNLVRGSWNGSITINGWGTNVELIVSTIGGAAQTSSNPFNVLAPAWTANVRIREVRFDGPDVQLRFQTLSNRAYQVEVATNFPSASWAAVDLPITGNGSEMQVTDPSPPFSAARFYRLKVTP